MLMFTEKEVPQLISFVAVADATIVPTESVFSCRSIINLCSVGLDSNYLKCITFREGRLWTETSHLASFRQISLHGLPTIKAAKEKSWYESFFTFDCIVKVKEQLGITTPLYLPIPIISSKVRFVEKINYVFVYVFVRTFWKLSNVVAIRAKRAERRWRSNTASAVDHGFLKQKTHPIKILMEHLELLIFHFSNNALAANPNFAKQW